MTIQWITGFLDFPAPVFEAGAGFWLGVTGYRMTCARRAERLGASRVFAEDGLVVLLSPGGLPFCVSGELADSPEPEFRHLTRPDGIPLRLLLQRTGDPPGAAVRAHPDLACSGVGAERARHESLGATWSHDGHGWVTMRDPAGLEYCITRRDPGTGVVLRHEVRGRWRR